MEPGDYPLAVLLLACAVALPEPEVVETPDWLASAPFEASLAVDGQVWSKHGRVHVETMEGDRSAVRRWQEAGRKDVAGVEVIEGEHRMWIRPRRVFADFAHVEWVRALWQSNGHLVEDIDQVAVAWDDAGLRLRATCREGCTETEALALRRVVAGMRASVDFPEEWRPRLRGLRIGLVGDRIVGQGTGG